MGGFFNPGHIGIVSMDLCTRTHAKAKGWAAVALPGFAWPAPPSLRGAVITKSSRMMLKGVTIGGPCPCIHRIGEIIQANLIPYRRNILREKDAENPTEMDFK